MSKLYIMDIIDGTVVDGPGFRLSIYSAGCAHKCKGCHNPQSWEMANGKQMSEDELMKIINDSPWNVTFSGGDPFFQAEAFAKLAERIKKETSKTIWCYTGYTLERILQERAPWHMELLYNIDALVDGPFVEELKDPDLQFRGSSNQRIIEKKDFNLPDRPLK